MNNSPTHQYEDDIIEHDPKCDCYSHPSYFSNYSLQYDEDYDTGTDTVGWRCLRFKMTSPQYFQYGYQANALSPFGGIKGTGPTGPMAGITSNGQFISWASGDLDGDETMSDFAQRGAVNTTTMQARLATQLEINDEFE